MHSSLSFSPLLKASEPMLPVQIVSRCEERLTEADQEELLGIVQRILRGAQPATQDNSLALSTAASASVQPSLS